jgi:hypothetical protein
MSLNPYSTPPPKEADSEIGTRTFWREFANSLPISLGGPLLGGVIGCVSVVALVVAWLALGCPDVFRNAGQGIILASLQLVGGGMLAGGALSILFALCLRKGCTIEFVEISKFILPIGFCGYFALHIWEISGGRDPAFVSFRMLGLSLTIWIWTLLVVGARIWRRTQ